jgi:hypothetical protein
MKKPLLALLLFSSIVFSCSDKDIVEPKTHRLPYEIATAWADVTLKIIKTTSFNTPTFSSRNLGYLGLTMYESVVHGSPVHKSLVVQLNELTSLPIPEAGKQYTWELALNAGQAFLLKKLYSHTTAKNLILIDSLESVIYNTALAENVEKETAERSVLFGQDMANAIFEWSTTDGGHEGYLHNFDKDYVLPTGAGYWTPPTDGQSTSLYPLHPYWGSNRTFLVANSLIAVPELLSYSTDPASDYYKQFLEVYNKSKSLTQEEKEIAAWWGDDPSQTASPPGHSYNLATIAIKTAKPDLFTTTEAYAKVGMATADAFINCWKCKYTYHAERPFPYIKAFIDDTYQKFWPEPPFPAFSSGHSTQAAAVATVLEGVFGENFKVVDNTYEGRSNAFQGVSIQYKSRTFNSIWETAEECAYSRFLGGIHTRQDNEQGAAQGIQIGNNVLVLDWKN